MDESTRTLERAARASRPRENAVETVELERYVIALQREGRSIREVATACAAIVRADRRDAGAAKRAKRAARIARRAGA